jgi:hypothetical protein
MSNLYQYKEVIGEKLTENCVEVYSVVSHHWNREQGTGNREQGTANSDNCGHVGNLLSKSIVHERVIIICKDPW